MSMPNVISKAVQRKAFAALVDAVYDARKDRDVHPEGTFDKAMRWYPSDREDCGGSGTRVRSPSRKWPYSYMLRCRTKDHVRTLVRAGLAGADVPPDVQRVLADPEFHYNGLVRPTAKRLGLPVAEISAAVHALVVAEQGAMP
jgi:hypothetical protein